MALNPVTIMEILRPWKRTGLDYIYSEKPICLQTLTKEVVAKHSVQSHPHAGEEKTVPSSTPASSAATSSLPQSSQEKTEDKQSNKIVSRETTQAHDANQPTLSPANAIPPANAISHQELIKKMPPHWHALYKKTKEAPVLWTYKSLGQDFFGNRSEERSQFLRTLMQSLNLARGTSFFWPCSDITPQGEVQLQPELFMAGILLFDPQFLIIMGSKIAVELHIPLPSALPFTQHIAQGRLFLLLPSFADLLKNSALAHQATTFLATSLQNKPLLNREK